MLAALIETSSTAFEVVTTLRHIATAYVLLYVVLKFSFASSICICLILSFYVITRYQSLNLNVVIGKHTRLKRLIASAVLGGVSTSTSSSKSFKSSSLTKDLNFFTSVSVLLNFKVFSLLHIHRLRLSYFFD